MSKQRVYVVDDDPGMRKSIEFMARSADLDVEAYSCAEAFLEDYSPENSGCLVLDVRMPGLSGLDLQERLAEQGAEIPIVFLSGHGTVKSCARAMKDGAVDFLEKPFDKKHLLDSIGRALEQDALRRRNSQLQRVFNERSQTLTRREEEVLELLVGGAHTKQIAAQLGISIKTVDNHRAKVLKKMEVENVVELVHLAMCGRTLQPQVDAP